MLSPSSFDEDAARERGRLLAVQAIAHNPDQKKRVRRYVRHRILQNGASPKPTVPASVRSLDKIFSFQARERID